MIDFSSSLPGNGISIQSRLAEIRSKINETDLGIKEHFYKLIAALMTTPATIDQFYSSNDRDSQTFLADYTKLLNKLSTEKSENLDALTILRAHKNHLFGDKIFFQGLLVLETEDSNSTNSVNNI